MNCISVKPWLSAYAPIAPSRIAASATKPGSPASLSLNKLSSVYTVTSLPRLSLKVAATASTSRYRKSAPVCLFGGKKSGNGNEGSPKEVLENFMGNFKKEQSIEDVLRQQIQKQEFFDDGGGSGKGGSGGGGGGGGSGGGGGGIGGPEWWDEQFQVFMATSAFVLFYIYILDREDLTRYTLDWIKVLFGGKMSLRLQRLIAQWRSDYSDLTRKDTGGYPYWLERAICMTPTRYDNPKRYRKQYDKLVGKPRKVKTRSDDDWQGFDDDYYY